MFKRLQKFEKSGNSSLFLWGARQTGKSTLIKEYFPEALSFDLLQSEVYQLLLSRPQAIREIVAANDAKQMIVIDEVQKIPILLNEVQWLIENKRKKFILTGSSPRKIIRENQNLLGGRALRYELYPLTTAEIPDFNLEKALNNGLLPSHYLAENAELMLSAYVNSFLEDEIMAEARIRNLSIFMNFLQKAAFSNGEMVNYTSIAKDCGVSSVTVKEYFQILVDSMIGKYVYPYQKRPKRQVVNTPKFYFFDIGMVNHLLKRKNVVPETENYGNAFEHFIYMEINAHRHYSQKNYDISFWRTSTKLEVDFIVGENELAVEVKSTDKVQSSHIKNLRAFSEEYTVKHSIVVCNEIYPRLVGNVLILPWREFLRRLWADELI